MTNFGKLYRKDVFVFKHEYSRHYIQKVFRALKNVKNQLELLEITRNVHESRMFSFLLLSYLIRRKRPLVPAATHIALKNLGDIATFTAFYLRHFKKLPPSWFINTLKQRAESMQGAQVDLFEHFNVPNKKVMKYLQQAGITFKQTTSVGSKIFWYAYTGQYKPLLKELFSKARAGKIWDNNLITFASYVLRDEEVLENNDVTALTLLLHYSAFKKTVAENPKIKPGAEKIIRALEDAVSFKMQLLENFKPRYDWMIIVNTECSRRRLGLHVKFKFYVDEIIATTAVVASCNNAKIAVVSDNFYEVPLQDSYTRTYTSVISTMLRTRTPRFKYQGRIPVQGRTLILAASIGDALKAEKAVGAKSDIMTYVPKELFIDVWPGMIVGFSERSANYLAVPVQ